VTTRDPEPAAGRRRSTVARRQDHALVEALLLGLTYDQAAERAQVSQSTVKRRLAEPGFQRQLQEAQSEHVKQLRRRLTAAGVAAAQVLVQIAGNVGGAADRSDARVRVYAASKLLASFVQLQPKELMQTVEHIDAPVIDYVIEGVDPEVLR
jgi:CRP-like cAMP-binding protein